MNLVSHVPCPMSHHFTTKKIPKFGRQKHLQSHASEVDIIDSYPNWKYTINMKIHNKLINNTFFYVWFNMFVEVCCISTYPMALGPFVPWSSRHGPVPGVPGVPPRSLGSLGVLVRTATVSMCPNLPKTKPA